ncbi:unnamed protein product, partial [Owenia fusiformis]
MEFREQQRFYRTNSQYRHRNIQSVQQMHSHLMRQNDYLWCQMQQNQCRVPQMHQNQQYVYQNQWQNPQLQKNHRTMFEKHVKQQRTSQQMYYQQPGRIHLHQNESRNQSCSGLPRKERQTVSGSMKHFKHSTLDGDYCMSRESNRYQRGEHHGISSETPRYHSYSKSMKRSIAPSQNNFSVTVSNRESEKTNIGDSSLVNDKYPDAGDTNIGVSSLVNDE